MKKYTIGEIFRLGLLKNWDGKPYKDKASVSNALARAGVPFEIVEGKYGKTKQFKESDLQKIQKNRQ